MDEGDRAHGREGVAGDPTEREGATVDAPSMRGALAPGAELGGRYRIVCRVGAGGMGEVWRAFDLKLRVEVALKALREDLFQDERRRELLRSEVRAAREVVSPNVCRIYDLEEIDGRELVSMEYVDGQTLLHLVRERGPLELKEAQDIASQFLAGLEAIHKAGLVHRDIKPENIMLTRADRVVVMDFGLARHEEDAGASRSGTPAYMAPEQAAGRVVDARADVYSAGVVLAEMVCPEGIKDIQSRQSLWEGVRSEPPKLPDTPWAPVLKKAVAREPGQRYHSAHTLTRALEDVTLRVVGAEDLRPYPGLAAFTEADAEYFFGREAEVEQMWAKLEGPARMLALVGPSGVGKTSFLRAGLMPRAGHEWRCLICKPGNNPELALSRGLGTELSGDAEAVDLLLRFDDPQIAMEAVRRWRRRGAHALVIVDQFEELFTQNAGEVQRRFAGLLRRLVLDADVHVLLSMRDDFLMRCRDEESFQPVFSDLTALPTLAGAPMRRALIQPAAKCGYRFEDDALVEEMLAEVEGERGALPLLAFAAARLWEKRDREAGLLTRQAYQDIGGVGGALARHAEATMDRIGPERVGIVRELFRNLVTAEGTRAVREWDELLSVFADSQRESAAEVFRQLVDARLLTSYEVKEEEHGPARRVEIIHESLLANWPRLVRWQTQDADAAQLRDQLRQAARTWAEHNRSDDLLWTASAYREFAVWRERYPGGLTELEEAFASAMTSLATRRRRRRRIAVAALITVLVAGLAVVGSFWRRSVLETRRAEASKLLALAEVQREKDPTEALAYAIASLDLADTPEARAFAVKALWTGPPVRAFDILAASPSTQMFGLKFSPDGRWLALSGIITEKVLVYGEGGGQPLVLGGHAVTAAGPIRCGWSRDGLLVTGHWTEERARVWAMPEGRLVREIRFGGVAYWWVAGDRLLARCEEVDGQTGRAVFRFRSWGLRDGGLEELGAVDPAVLGVEDWAFGPGGGTWLYSKRDGVFSLSLPIRAGAPGTLVARHSSGGVVLGGMRDGELFSTDEQGEIIVWGASGGVAAPGRRIRGLENATARLVPDRTGRWAVGEADDRPRFLWDLAGLRGARGEPLRRGAGFRFFDFHPRGGWLASLGANATEVCFWPLEVPRSLVVDGWLLYGFSPDRLHLVTSDDSSVGGSRRVRLWPLPGCGSSDFVDLELPAAGSLLKSVVVDDQGRRVLTEGYGDNVFLLPAKGGDPRQLQGFPAADMIEAAGFSPSGRLAAAATAVTAPAGKATLRVWDLQTGETRAYDQPEDREGFGGVYAGSLAFADETTLFTAGANGLLRWDIETGAHERLAGPPRGGILAARLTPGRHKLLVFELDQSFKRQGTPQIRDLSTGEVRDVDIPGKGWPALGGDGAVWASGEEDGRILVGRVGGGEPHLLFGHAGPVYSVAVSPDGRWIASGSEDGTIRLWPMPDLAKPPLHTRPHDELVAKLKSLTNLRAVPDPGSDTGWKIEIGPFPGWATVPTWNP